MNEVILSSNACILIYFVEFHKDRAIIIDFSLVFFEISLVELIEPNRHILHFVDIELDDDFLPALAINVERGGDIARLVVSDNCIFEVSEDVFLFHFNLASSMLVVVLKFVRTVWTHDRIIPLSVNVLQIEDLPILEIFQTVPGNEGYPVILRVSCQ